MSAVTNDSPTINHKIMFGLFAGFDPFNQSSVPASRLMYELGDVNTRYLVDDIIKLPSNTDKFFLLVKDLIKNGGT